MPRITAAVIVLCLGVALAGAAPRKPAPSPSPSPSPAVTAAPPAALPLVVVFPFDTSNDIRAGTGQSAAQLYVQQMNAAGGLDVIPGPASVKRSDYRTYAKHLNADYYLAGYMTPLGTGVSLVEQVVSVRSGTIVYGQTAQIESFQDATAQATTIHDGIVALERQLSDAYSSAQAQATSTPSAGNQANLTPGLASITGLFKHRGKSTPGPAVAKPAKGVFVTHVGGSLPAGDLSSATSTLYTALLTHYNAHLTSVAPRNITRDADAICGTARNNTVASGTASAKMVHRGLGSRAEYTFVLGVYTCFGAKLAESSATGGSLASAIRAAVENYAQEHPDNG